MSTSKKMFSTNMYTGLFPSLSLIAFIAANKQNPLLSGIITVIGEWLLLFIYWAVLLCMSHIGHILQYIRIEQLICGSDNGDGCFQNDVRI